VENDWEFHSSKLLALERLASLCINEELGSNQLVNKTCSPHTAMNNAVEVVFKLDQAIFAAQKLVSSPLIIKLL